MLLANVTVLPGNECPPYLQEKSMYICIYSTHTIGISGRGCAQGSGTTPMQVYNTVSEYIMEFIDSISMDGLDTSYT